MSSGVESRLARSFAALERNKDVVLEQVRGWSQTRLAFHPEPAAWSALQVIDHLQRTEAGILETMRSNLAKDHAVRLKDRAGTAMMLVLMRSPIRVKTPPSASAILPGDDLDLLTLADAWSKTRLVMATFLPEIVSQPAAKGLFRHPVSGWMTGPQTMHFLLVHLTHHFYQLKTVERSSAKMAA